jgi:hypothetical protein
MRQSDVKNRLSQRCDATRDLRDPVSESDITGPSLPKPDAVKADRSTFAQDFVTEHSSPGATVAPAHLFTGSDRLDAASASKSAQA